MAEKLSVDKLTYTHPMFMNPGDTPGMILIPVKLTGSQNYGMWIRSMRIALMAKRKLGLATGTCKRESFEAELHEHWDTCNDLQERFDKVNRMRIFQVHRLWDEYDVMVPPPGCDCAKSKDYIEHFYQQRLLQFLVV
ncbi:uncharacterized protein [Nicotiana sylvestris]|uniref:uncharacterized protein n=1 Tax=Nicotiana sylvestris TaxID=4096 RepID=UPI00388CA796